MRGSGSFAGIGKERGHGEEGAEEEMFAAVEGIRKVAEAEGVPMSRLAIAWTIAKPGITCELVGTRNVSELEENLRVASVSLSPETYGKIG